MKKILLLGGSAQQIVAIETAQKLGYYTVLCDYLEDNPGQYCADKFYLVSTVDKDAVLKVAKEENVDGVLAYASDPAAPTAAFVAKELKLPGNPVWAVETLCNKDCFRHFLSKNGFNAPKADGYKSKEVALEHLNEFQLPVIVKPVDSSGSKGATVLHALNNAEQAIDFAFNFSRCHRIIIEEFIEKKHPYLIGGDIFVLNNKIVLWGLMNCYRDSKVNPLVPVGKSYPLKLNKEDIENVKKTLRAMIEALQISNGALNVEIIVDKDGMVWPIDVGPRSGGNMIPDLMGYIFNVDIPELSVKTVMGETISLDISEGIPYYATHNLHTSENGIYDRIEFDSLLEKYIIKKCLYKKQGDKVEYFDNATKALGIIFMKFSTEAEMDKILENIDKYIHVFVTK